MLDYGIIGNCSTLALVKKNASIDWMCFPTFSSPSILAKLLDAEKGGSIEIQPEEKFEISQHYWPNTAILETRFESPTAAFAVIDFFPWFHSLQHSPKREQENKVIRLIIPRKGKPKLSVRVDVRPHYAIQCATWKKNDSSWECAEISGLCLTSDLLPEQLWNQQLFSLQRPVFLILGHVLHPERYSVKTCKQLLTATKKYWEKWCASLVLPNQYREVIIRSAITLKLLSYSKTGAILAAATTSVPEQVATERTFDYRYCWVRDASQCADAFKKIGRNLEPKRLLEFFINLGLRDDFVQVLYGIEGETRLKERELLHLAGFQNSRPVRIGNAAYDQVQHDIFGVLIDIMFLYFVFYEFEPKMTQKHWRFLRYLVNQIKFSWEKKDNGIWEFRGKQEHFVYSKFMCFVGVNRAIQICHHFNRLDWAEEWIALNNEIYQDLLSKGYHPQKNAFTMYYGGNELDAALLLLAYYDFLPPNDERLINTIHRIQEELRQGSLVQRYSIQDDFGKSTSAFLLCSFWLVDALFYIGETEKARTLFQELLTKTNHVGLYSEDLSIQTGEQLGNFPQAYSHLALINTAVLLSEWSKRRQKFERPKIIHPARRKSKSGETVFQFLYRSGRRWLPLP